jgi:hypothetical protein
MGVVARCPLLGAKRTSFKPAAVSANDPKQTSAAHLLRDGSLAVRRAQAMSTDGWTGEPGSCGSQVPAEQRHRMVESTRGLGLARRARRLQIASPFRGTIRGNEPYLSKGSNHPETVP